MAHIPGPPVRDIGPLFSILLGIRHSRDYTGNPAIGLL